jgi:hypothetical protein
MAHSLYRLADGAQLSSGGVGRSARGVLPLEGNVPYRSEVAFPIGSREKIRACAFVFRQVELLAVLAQIGFGMLSQKLLEMDRESLNERRVLEEIVITAYIRARLASTRELAARVISTISPSALGNRPVSEAL